MRPWSQILAPSRFTVFYRDYGYNSGGTPAEFLLPSILTVCLQLFCHQFLRVGAADVVSCMGWGWGLNFGTIQNYCVLQWYWQQLLRGILRAPDAAALDSPRTCPNSSVECYPWDGCSLMLGSELRLEILAPSRFTVFYSDCGYNSCAGFKSKFSNLHSCRIIILLLPPAHPLVGLLWGGLGSRLGARGLGITQTFVFVW